MAAVETEAAVMPETPFPPGEPARPRQDGHGRLQPVVAPEPGAAPSSPRAATAWRDIAWVGFDDGADPQPDTATWLVSREAVAAPERAGGGGGGPAPDDDQPL